ncbi:MAG: isopentenyl phosphate kinase family protein [Chloroflexi bacterium]|nr:isopentenyl phosphate kinase family protein [Chloroflexota bacterium]
MVFLKLGGSLLTDKQQENSVRYDHLSHVVGEIRRALDQDTSLRLLIGHGSGSFGHFAAARTGLLSAPAPNWPAYAEVGAAAARLNRIVADALLAGGVPAVTLQPSAAAHCDDGQIISLATEPVATLLRHGLVPLVYGDVALDLTRGYTIISTETIFAALASRLQPGRILLAGEVSGVYTADPQRDPTAQPIPLITQETFSQVEQMLGGSAGVDVTGGMATKVRHMLDLAAISGGLEVWVISGTAPGNIYQALLGQRPPGSTLLKAK